MRRSVSVAVSYLLLVAAVLAADIILVSGYLGFVYRASGWVPRIVHDVGQGLVYGAYAISMCQIYKPDWQRRELYVIEVPCIHVSLSNPNPVPVEVVLLAHLPEYPGDYRVVEVVSSMEILLWGKSPPEGVRLVDASGWFMDGRSVKSILMEPHASVSFAVPIYYSGAPSVLLACTRVGCTKLHTVGAQTVIQRPSASWILFPSDTQRPQPQLQEVRVTKFSAHQTVEWNARTLGGQGHRCSTTTSHERQYPITMLSILLKATECCEDCPANTRKVLDRSWTRSWCYLDFRDGTMVSPSALLGYPPGIVVGYFTTDPNFEFVVPIKQVRTTKGSHTLLGFNSQIYSRLITEYNHVVGDWKNYANQECNRRYVNITISLFADPDRTQPLRMLYPNSRRAYVLVVARGFIESSGLFNLFKRWDNVFVRVDAVHRFIEDGKAVTSKKTVVYLETRYTSDYVSNAENLESAYIDLGNTYEIIVNVVYEMVGEEPIMCHKDVEGLIVYCGSSYDRHVRLGFYVEIIPEQYFR